jgi:AraC family transcriptional regulator
MDLSRIYKTVDFIEQNYNKQISVKELENISCYSYRNIQRIFKYSFNETIGAYQIRLRLERAYKLILYSKSSFSEIAYEVGFESLSAFSKAFKKQYGFSPKQAKNEKLCLFNKLSIAAANCDEIIQPSIIFLPEVKVYYQSIFTNYVNKEINLLWDGLTSSYPSDSSIQFYGVIADESLITEEIKCRYDACSTDQRLEHKLNSKNILGRKYAKFIHLGSYATIEKTYEQIYSGWILTCELEFDNSPFIEQYIKHSGNTSTEIDYITAILLPLKS